MTARLLNESVECGSHIVETMITVDMFEVSITYLKVPDIVLL